MFWLLVAIDLTCSQKFSQPGPEEGCAGAVPLANDAGPQRPGSAVCRSVCRYFVASDLELIGRSRRRGGGGWCAIVVVVVTVADADAGAVIPLFSFLLFFFYFGGLFVFESLLLDKPLSYRGGLFSVAEYNLLLKPLSKAQDKRAKTER